jgi:hypothetical protein
MFSKFAPNTKVHQREALWRLVQRLVRRHIDRHPPEENRPSQKDANQRKYLPQGDLLIRQTRFFTRYHGGSIVATSFSFPPFLA